MAKIEIVRSDENWMTYAVKLTDPAEWVQEKPWRGDLARQLLVLIAEFEEEEVANALGVAMLAQEGRRRGTFKLL